MYTLREYFYSRTIVLGTAAVATFLELMLGAVFLAIKRAKVQDLENYSSYKDIQKKSEYELVKKVKR